MTKRIAVGFIIFVVVAAITWYVYSSRHSPVVVRPKTEDRQSVAVSRAPQNVQEEPFSDISARKLPKESEALLVCEETNSIQAINCVSLSNVVASNAIHNDKTETGIKADNQPMNEVNQDRALEIAHGAIGKTKYANSLPITIESTNGQYLVKFPVDKSAPPGSRYRGPDCAAEVYIDKKTGKVIEVRIGD